MEGKPKYKTSLSLPEGVYEVFGTYNCASKQARQQRALKSSYARVIRLRPTPASPKPKSSLSLSLKSKKTIPFPSLPISGSTNESADVEFLVYPCGDSICVCNLSITVAEAAKTSGAWREKTKSFSQDPTCCSINRQTSSGDYLEVLVGFENGDIILLDAISMAHKSKYNVNAALNASRVTDVEWLPGSKTQFVAAFGNGVLLVLDSTKEDGSPKTLAAAAAAAPSGGDLSMGGDPSAFSVLRSKTQKNNPVSRWHVGKGCINHIAFSSDGKLALSCQDGLARVLDMNTEKLLFSFRSQYGAMLCSAWSPDNEYLVTGGEDDLVIVWSFADKCPVARCLGHNSWLSVVEFDPLFCISKAMAGGQGGQAQHEVPYSASNYRFLSVAQDGRMCYWDLNDGNLVLSRKRAGAPRRSSAASWNEAAARSALYNVAELSRPEEVPSMEPIYNALITQEPLSSLHVTEGAMLTVTFGGESRVWARPGGSTTQMRDEDDSR